MNRLILSQAQTYLAEYVEYGMCATDPRVTVAINLAIERLMPKLNPDKTIGRYQFDVVNNVITMPREIKTVLAASTQYPSCAAPAPAGCGGCGPGCTTILSVKSKWYEMLPGGPVGFVPCAQNVLMDMGSGYSTFADVPPNTSWILRLYADIPQATSEGIVVINGLDGNGNHIIDYVNQQYVPGAALSIPVQGQNYTDSTQQFSQIISVTKPDTKGRIRLFGVDPATGIQTPMAVYEPDELNPDYRRYMVTWFGTLPDPPMVLTVLAKRRWVRTTSPYADLLITNLGALQNALMGMKFERAGSFDQAAQCWRTAFMILDDDTKDADGDYQACVQLQQEYTGGGIWNLH